MPKLVDHDERRRGLARTAADVVAARGLDALTFRELAARAGVSVALVQHYFGTKAQLLVHTLDQVSVQVEAQVASRLVEAGPHAPAGARLFALAEAFLPTDDDSRAAMVVYLSFAAGALTDGSLRDGAAFSRGEDLRAFVAAELGAATLGAATLGAAEGEDGPQTFDPGEEATTIVALLLGMSLLALLPGGGAADLLGPFRRHLGSLGLLPG